ncbi:hypothetical protein PG989_016474 [Apiospora arundinis]
MPVRTTKDLGQSPMDYEGQRLGTGESTRREQPEQTTQTSGLRIKQGSSTFESAITLSGKAQSSQGNQINGIEQGDVETEGSRFAGNVQAGDDARSTQGDQFNGQKAHGTSGEAGK